MSKRVRGVLLAVCTLAMAAGVVYGDLKKGLYSPAKLGSLQQPAPLAPSPDSTYEASAYPAPPTELSPGDGLQDVQIYCNTCHSPRYITMQPPLSAATWEAEVDKMDKAYGAGIPEDSKQKIILYLRAHYTVENRKPSNSQ
jgi:hypothetical protein